MKQTVLKQPLESARRQLRIQTALCILAILLTLAFNLVLVLTVSERTNHLFCGLNIAADVLCGVFVIWYCAAKIAPGRVLRCLAEKSMTDCYGAVKSISNQTVRYMDMDCVELTVGDRKLFLPVDTMELRVGETYRFRLVSNIIMEAEQ